MNKYVFMFFFLIAFNLTIQLTEEDIEKYNNYYDYAVSFLDGLAKKDGEQKGKCATLLENNKEYFIPIIIDIKNQTDNGVDLSAAFLKHIFDFLFLEESCHVTQLATFYTGMKIDEIFNETLYQIGKEINEIIGLKIN